MRTCVKYLCTAAKNQNNFTTYVLFTYIPKFIYSIYLSQVFKSRVNELHAAIEKNRQRKPTSPIPMSNHNKKNNKVRRRSEEKSSSSAMMVTSNNFGSGSSVPV